jgi:branched-chain amino acid aminotransferase
VDNGHSFVNFDGAILRSDKAILTADNRSFRYGDGLFETIKVKKGRICLENYHFERLMAGVSLLQFEPASSFTPGRLAGEILELCEKNGHMAFARVRLVVFRGDGSLYDPIDPFPHYIIQSWPLAAGSDAINENGLALDIFPDGRKPCDPLANLKSNNYLLYVMAALYARKNRLNDCLVLNSRDRIADSTIANVFYCKDGEIYTPPLSEGCVAGVMRHFLMDFLPKAGFTLREKITTANDLQNAEGVFLTNAIRGIQWVGSFGRTTYNDKTPRAVYQALSNSL